MIKQYKGDLGNFEYDDREFKLKGGCLRYIGTETDGSKIKIPAGITNCSYMFYGCTKLNYIKCLATDISANNCIDYWVDGVSSTGTFIKNPDMNSWTIGVDGIPEGWTVKNNGDAGFNSSFNSSFK